METKSRLSRKKGPHQQNKTIPLGLMTVYIIQVERKTQAKKTRPKPAVCSDDGRKFIQDIARVFIMLLDT